MLNKIDKVGEEIQLVAFKLENEEYTVPIESIKEIIMPQTATHLPNTPDFVEGVINLRGQTIPVIDGRKRFNMKVKENDTETRIIVFELEDHLMGLIVDSVSEVIHLDTENIDPPPVEAGEDNKFLVGIGKYNDRLLILLEPVNFLNMNETENIQQTMQVAKNLINTKEKIEKKEPSK